MSQYLSELKYPKAAKRIPGRSRPISTSYRPSSLWGWKMPVWKSSRESAARAMGSSQINILFGLREVRENWRMVYIRGIRIGICGDLVYVCGIMMGFG